MFECLNWLRNVIAKIWTNREHIFCHAPECYQIYHSFKNDVFKKKRWHISTENLENYLWSRRTGFWHADAWILCWPINDWYVTSSDSLCIFTKLSSLDCPNTHTSPDLTWPINTGLGKWILEWYKEICIVWWVCVCYPLLTKPGFINLRKPILICNRRAWWVRSFKKITLILADELKGWQFCRLLISMFFKIGPWNFEFIILLSIIQLFIAFLLLP